MIVCYLDELKEGFFPYVQVGHHHTCIALGHVA
jgi:hypothetical protein